MDSDYILVDNNLDNIEIDSNSNINNIINIYYTEYYDYIINYSDYIINDIIPVISDITFTIKDIFKAALKSNDEYYQYHPFNY